jgi:hypothetical protein
LDAARLRQVVKNQQVLLFDTVEFDRVGTMMPDGPLIA